MVIPLRDAHPPRRTPWVTLTLIALCALAFAWELVVEATSGDDGLSRLVEQFGFVPADIVAALQAGDYLSPAVLHTFSAMFLHGGWLHLLGNLLYLWIFANNVEDRVGRIVFLVLYLLGGIAASAAHLVSDPSSSVPAIGASGAISAVLGAYLVLYPRARIQSLVFLGFFYQLIAVPSVFVLGFWFVLQLVDGIAALGHGIDAGGGVAVWAHIGGFVFGMLFALPFRFLGRRPVAVG